MKQQQEDANPVIVDMIAKDLPGPSRYVPRSTSYLCRPREQRGHYLHGWRRVRSWATGGARCNGAENANLSGHEKGLSYEELQIELRV